MSLLRASANATWGMRFNQAPLLLLLLTIDIAFIALHVWLLWRGLLDYRFNIEADGSIPEWFNYAKWAVSAFACGYAFSRRREPLYLVWSTLFVYFLLDDARQIHEQFGNRLVHMLDLGPAFALRAQDFGELGVSLVAAMVLLGVMAILYMRANVSSHASVSFTRRQLPWLGGLIFCGVIVDMLHIQIGILDSPTLTSAFGVVEDGGEMIAASFLAAISIREAALISSGQIQKSMLSPWQHAQPMARVHR